MSRNVPSLSKLQDAARALVSTISIESVYAANRGSPGRPPLSGRHGILGCIWRNKPRHAEQHTRRMEQINPLHILYLSFRAAWIMHVRLNLGAGLANSILKASVGWHVNSKGINMLVQR
jgi:hypothetical protein